ncbi:MAG: toll/interleukin-1 receptor domain-containing protein [Desulfobacteraceae bacterium]|nr:toll/interleukin-1 receptor domain-containing protein [Desulfobacteraceae bacterium]
MKSDAKIFISCVEKDNEIAKRLCNDLESSGLSPWLESESLLAGQNRREMIRKAIKNSSYFLALLSSGSVSKKGPVQKQLNPTTTLKFIP